MPVAAQVARALDAPLDVLCVRKLGLPANPEYAIGAIAEDGVRVVDGALLDRFGVSADALHAVEARERRELDRQAAKYRRGRAPVALDGRTVIIVDDGLATGSTARAAARCARARHAARILLAVPVGAPESLLPAQLEVDDVIVVEAPAHFVAVGAWYEEFGPTSDDEVISALRAARADHRPDPDAPVARTAVRIPAGGATLDGWFDVPAEVRAVVVFAHGSGSSRHSGRNQAVAAELNRHGFATLLFDLLTDAESGDRDLVFDIPFLAARLRRAVDWVRTRPEARRIPIGLFGASTGAGAALVVAAAPDSGVDAVVSRGGRPDLAGSAIEAVRCPVLLVVGGADRPTFEANEFASARLHAPHVIEIVPGATHLFEEPGALERVARLASDWFVRHLVRAPSDGILSTPGAR